jgi:glycerate dehydrogenase
MAGKHGGHCEIKLIIFGRVLGKGSPIPAYARHSEFILETDLTGGKLPIHEALMKIVILDGHAINPGDLSWDALRSLGDLEVFDRTPEDTIVLRAREAEAVLTTRAPLSAQTLAQLNRLRYVGAMFTGYDEIDLKAARERKLVVTNVPTYGTSSVAQLVFALLLELCHHVGLHSEATHAGEWSRSPDFSFWKTPLVELQDKTMGIVGFGRIGRRVAEIAVAMGMRVIAADAAKRNPPNWPGFRWCDVDELMAIADVVSLHCPLLPETRGMINAASLSKMKQGSFLINTSRGPLIIEQDLADALDHGRLAGAAVDVLSSEPPTLNDPLLHAKNCIVTPHIAWATKQARTRLIETVVANLRAFLDGRPVNVVD